MRWPLLLLVLLSLSCASTSRAPISTPDEIAVVQRAAEEAEWRQHVFAWYQSADARDPVWRTDPRLAGRFHSTKFPDDLQVLFTNEARYDALRHEVMWVRLIAFDDSVDLYLGVLLNQPHALPTVVQNDNVVVAPSMLATVVVPPASEPTSHPIAVSLAGRYDTAGWPSTATAGLEATVIDGLRAYRRGNFGHNEPEIDHCVSLLRPAMKQAATQPVEWRHLGHFILGRCQAERYDTRAAIDDFRAAIRLRQDDPHAQMGLVAELSVMAHDASKQEPEGAAFWEEQYLAEIQVMRTRFPLARGVELIDLVMKEGAKAAVEKNDPRFARIGAGIIRNKSR